MTSGEIRASFLAYFERHGHRAVASSSLVPSDDPTLLFTNAGMNQFKDVFLGKEHREYSRAASSQKCMRVSGKHNDLDNVGPSLRHHTFFEMLGNFSFGDYFKAEAIELAWRLLTEEWQIPPDRLFATIFSGDGGIPRDDEAHEVWTRFVPAARITELGAADNFWSMGDVGPCGRCSEIHHFRGNDLPCSEPVCLGVACSCDRYVEIWNNVFMEFDRNAEGVLTPLPAPSIDTGMGLERITALMQGVLSNYDTDLFASILAAIGARAGRRYGDDRAVDVSMRVVADHVRAATFLIGDGVTPSNEWRGYVLRKIMRRAMRHGKRLGVDGPLLSSLVDVVVGDMRTAYPALVDARDYIVKVVTSEEGRFDAVLTHGLPKLEEAIDRAARDQRPVSGDDAFLLYDSLGVPMDFIEDLASERRVGVDRDAFDRAMAAQRERARAASAFDVRHQDGFTFASDADRTSLAALDDRFDGYDATTVDAAIRAVFDEQRRQTTALAEGESGFVVLDRTPFYVESGGQVSDRGRLERAAGAGAATVEAMGRLRPGGPRVHKVRVSAGSLEPGAAVRAIVDAEARDATRRNHTATHLLHAALRQRLGAHVKQAGSLVAPDRLRFDFHHFSAVTPDELQSIERVVNEQVYHNVAVQTEVRPTSDAIAAGAMALFGEKYGDHVRVVTVPGFSVELCGGTHCRSTGEIGPFSIVEETSVAAGIRRLEALTGEASVRRMQDQRATLARVGEALNATGDQAVDAVKRLQADVKRLSREVGELRVKAALGAGAGEAQDDSIEIAGVRFVARRVSGLGKDDLRTLADSLKSRMKTGVVVLAAAGDGKVSIVVAVTPDLTGRVHAGGIAKRIAPIVGGKGGGRPDFAEAGGKDADQIGSLLEESRRAVEQSLGA